MRANSLPPPRLTVSVLSPLRCARFQAVEAKAAWRRRRRGEPLPERGITWLAGYGGNGKSSSG